MKALTTITGKELRISLYKPTIVVDDYVIYLMNSRILTGMCGREIIAHQNGLDSKSIHHSIRIINLTYKSIRYN